MDEQVAQYRIVSPEMTVEALRENGYKSTAHALAELIDNAVEADAKLIELIVLEEPTQVATRVRNRVSTIAVLDDGGGMDAETLRQSLRFGSGTRRDRKVMGRFGVGLPASSMSQCKHVDVWSWQNGPDNALYTYLDLKEISAGLQEDVPEPKLNPVPDAWQRLGLGFGATGTLVVWTELDKVQWREAAATLRNTALLIGRIYRRFIAKGRCQIRLAVAQEGALAPTSEAYVLPNDPLYLMAPSSTPTPFHDVPMFEPLGASSTGEIGEEHFPMRGADGGIYTVRVRTSVVRDAARDPDQDEVPWPANVSKALAAGSTPWGEHAKRNLGVSIMRADRELAMDTGWANASDTRERFWGVEIDFPPQLDEVFGVTNNKQAATILAEFANFDWREEAEGLSYPEFLQMLDDEGDQRRPLIELVYHVREKLLKQARDHLVQQGLGTRSSQARHGAVEKRANEAVRRLRAETAPTRTETLAEQMEPAEIEQQQIESLVEQHQIKPADAKRMVEELRRDGKHVTFIESRNSESSAFFGVQMVPNLLEVSLNVEHPVYDKLVAVLDDVPQNASKDELLDRLNRASDALKLLLISWARYEDSLPTPGAQQRARQTRQDWGRIAKEFMLSDEEDDE